MPISPLSQGNMEVKKREKKDEVRGSDLHADPPVQPVISEDGRCTCCPYGYHIDLDFLNFCQNITNGSTLRNLKHIQRTKRKLRKSMEFMLQQQQHGQEGGPSSSLPAPVPPPDVVNSTEASRLIHMVNYEQSATNQVLRDIDSAVNATLASIDSMQWTKPSSRRYMSSDSDESSVYSPITPLSASSFVAAHQSQFDGFPSQPPPPPPRKSSLRYAHHSEGEDTLPGRKDSMSSVSSVSTVSSEQVLAGGSFWNGAHSSHTLESPASTVRQHPEGPAQNPQAITAESLAAAMAAHFPPKDHGGQELPSTPMSPNTTISKASLAAIREAMAVSLHRLRDLEEQVKAIPILQVRISVLKEEKRLLALQLKAKSGNVSTRTVAVGEDAEGSPPSSFSRSLTFFSGAAAAAHHHSAIPVRSPTVKTPPATFPKPARMKTDTSVGEHSVVEPYLLQPRLPTGYTITDNRVENEIRKKSEERKTSADHAVSAQNHVSVRHGVPHTAPRPVATRSIGVGDGDVNAQPLHIHNTEVRTVIISANNATVAKRNVGVEVKVPSRSVGVSFHPKDVAPTMRTVGVNVTLESFPKLESSSGGESELGKALQNALQREVSTVGTCCNIRPITTETGMQHGSTGVGSGSEGENTDDSLRQCVPQKRCVGTMARAVTRDESVNTEKVGQEEEGVGAVRTTETCDASIDTDSCGQNSVSTSVDRDWGVTEEERCDQAVNTDPRRQDDASTCTEPRPATHSASQTDVAVFEKLEVVSSTGTSTTPVPLTTTSSNTPTLTTADKSIGITTSELLLTDDKATSPDKAFCNRGVNTCAREPVLRMSKVECVEISGEDDQAAAKTSPKRPLTMQEHILQRGADQAFAFLGSTSSSGSLSPTSPKRLPGRSPDPDSGKTTAGEADDCFTGADMETSLTQQTTAGLEATPSAAQSLPEKQNSEKEQSESLSANIVESPVRRRDVLTDMMTKQSGSRLIRHRHSDGARISQELDSSRPGIFSGHRVGSVEDFMPDEMRRLMNLDTVESENKSRSLATDSNSSWTVKISKATHTITTTQTCQEGSSEVTQTVTEQDSDEEDEAGPDRKSFGKLSMGQLDLSQIAGDTNTVQEDSPSEGSENEGIKDSGYDDSHMAHNGGESSSLQGLDFASMGSLERKELKSIMKTTKSCSPSPKKGISFAESVVGGTGSSSEEEGTESDEDSTTSYEEGSYDSREGDITYRCEDDEAIAQGLPGAKMYDQNIRETYELSEDMYKSCRVLADYLVDSTTIQTKELNAHLGVVQEEWFRVSSHKLSSVYQVEDYLSSINEISHRLLEYIVNLVDGNGNAAIHYCVSHCNFDIVGLLLDTEVCDVRKPNKAGYSPAMLASLAFIQNDDHRHIIRQLFMAGNINSQAEKTGQTALMLATSQCRVDMVELLLETGADCNLQDHDGSTALMCACEHGHAAIVHLLLAQPACDASLTDNEQSTALSIAMEASHKDIGVILYKHLNFSPTSGTLENTETDRHCDVDHGQADIVDMAPTPCTMLLATASSSGDRESSPETEV